LSGLWLLVLFSQKFGYFCGLLLFCFRKSSEISADCYFLFCFRKSSETFVHIVTFCFILGKVRKNFRKVRPDREFLFYFREARKIFGEACTVNICFLFVAIRRRTTGQSETGGQRARSGTEEAPRQSSVAQKSHRDPDTVARRRAAKRPRPARKSRRSVIVLL